MRNFTLALAFILLAPSLAFAQSGPVANWRLNGDATDASGNNITGTLMNGPTYSTDSKEGTNSLVLNGTNQYITFGNPAGLPTTTGARTLCAWGKTTVTDTYRWIAAFGTSNGANAMFIGMNGTTLQAGAFGDDLIVANTWTVNTWHHVCLTYDGTTAKLYFDGVLVASGARNWYMKLSKVYIGRQVDDAEYWKGLVDDVRIYNRALSQSEVQAIVTPVTLPSPPTALIATATSSSTIKLTWTDNSSNETGFQVERSSTSGTGFVPVATPGANVLTYTDINLSPATKYYYQVRATIAGGGNSAATNEQNATTMAAGLIGNWLLNGDATDISGNGLVGVLKNGAAFDNNSKEGGSALVLDGVSQYVDLGNPASLPSGTAARSMSVWAKTSSIAAGYGWIAAFGSTANGGAMFIGRNGNALTVGGYGNDLSVANVWTVDTWHHVCLTYNGTTAIAYVDGVQVASGAKNWNLIQSKAYIGRQVNGNEYWGGSVDDLRIYGKALTAADVRMLAMEPPRGLAITALGTTNVNLKWVDNAASEMGYRIERSQTSGTGYSLLMTTAANVVTYTDATITSGTRYYYHVSAINADGAISAFSNEETIDPVHDAVNNLAFQYRYDQRGRMSAKKVPGADWVYMVYDNKDRLVFTQDGNQRKDAYGNPKMDWTFTKYDVLNRPVMTGIYTHSAVVDQSTMAGLVSTTNFYENYVGVVAPANHGYTNNVFPTQNIQILTITYYDTYDFRTLWGSGYAYVSDNLSKTVNGVTYLQPASENSHVTGQVTGSKIKVLGSESWLKDATYYDDKYRVIQTIADNAIGGTEVTSQLLDFVGKILDSKTTHSRGMLSWSNPGVYDVTSTSVISNSGGNGGTITATQQLAANTNGYVEFSSASTQNTEYVSFAPTPSYITLAQGYWSVFDNNISQISGSFVAGTVFRIERTSGVINYYANGTKVYTSPTASTGALTLNVTLNRYQADPSSITNIRSSFGKEINTIERSFDYDHAGRLLKTWHTVSGAPATVLLVNNQYNELGQLIDKKLHSEDNGSSFKQSVDYRYNIRGWLTSMNNSQLADDHSTTNTNDDTNDLFGMNLLYNISDANLGSTGMYNGNISGMKWSVGLGKGDTKELGYNFSYDAMNRLTAANSRMNKATWQAGYYDENGLTYDLNGNIMTLTRKGDNNLQIDNLKYGYYGKGNQLQYVNDNTASVTDKRKGFTDGNSGSGGDGAGTAVDYSYDANGNLTHDLNKGIGTSLSDAAGIITYNYLNLPETVTKAGNTIRYIYDASGCKLSQVVSFGNTKKQTDYVGEFQYENDALQFINHEEGRIVVSGTNLLYTNSFDVLTTGITTTNATAAAYANNGEKYVKATSNGTTGGGLTQIGKVYTVTGGDRYRIRVKGYSGASPAYLQVTAGATVLYSPGASLPNSATTESWVEQIVTIPGTGTSTMKVAVVWNTNTAGEVLYVNELDVNQLTITAPEYQYNLEDHLGNVRLTFTSKNDVQSNTATMEAANQLAESRVFVNYDRVRIVNSSPLFDHTNNVGGNGSSIRLSGNTNEKTGLVKTLAVMPGDIVHMEVYAKYLDTNPANWDGALAALVSNISAGSSSVVTDGSSYNTNGSNPFPYTGLNGTGSSNNTGPKAYLNYIMFDKDFNPIITDPSQTNYKRMSNFAMEKGTTGTLDGVAHEPLIADVTVKQPGYMYIYLSNEEATPVEVYFDDFKVTQTKSPIIASNDYYPFGLTYNSFTRENSVPNAYQYNGKEMQDEMNLGWLDYGARMYDPTISRWITLDPLADQMRRHSPYNYAFNNPVRFIDPDGMGPGDFTTSKIQLHNEDDKTHLKETTVSVNTITKTLKEGETGFTDALGGVNITAGNGIGNEIIERTTTTTTTVTETVTQYDENGKVAAESTRQTKTVTTQTDIIVKDQNGGFAGSKSTSTTANPVVTRGANVNLSKEMKTAINEVHDYKAGAVTPDLHPMQTVFKKYFDFITDHPDVRRKNLNVGPPHENERGAYRRRSAGVPAQNRIVPKKLNFYNR